MPFCPKCKTEYIAGVTRCSDCDILLVDSLPEDHPIIYEECGNCSEPVTVESDFCVHCGVLLSEENFFCEKHPNIKAIAVCIICWRLMCDNCARKKAGKMLCDEHKKVEISEDWAVAFQSVDYYEANIVRGKLESAGVTVNPRNNASIGYIADGFIEGPIAGPSLSTP